MLTEGTDTIQQLEPRKGGYCVLELEHDLVHSWPKQRATRLICTLEGAVAFQCGLNHMGNGNYYIILAKRHLDTLNKSVGDNINYALAEDPNPLGVAVPEVLEVLLDQDTRANEAYEQLTDGKKRGLIHSINRIKDIDKQVKLILMTLGVN